jgi:hypothetical protein
MHVPINVKSPNNINKWQMGFNSAFKGLKAATIAQSAHTSTVKIVAGILRRSVGKVEDVLGGDQFGFRKGKETGNAIGMLE